MSQRSPWAVLVLACAAQFLVVLDVSIVNVALPAIREGLGFGASGLEWVVNAYALTFAGFLLLGGRMGDLYGSRRVLVAGLALFTVASLVGGLAGSPGLLIGARALQGLGAAILAPATMTVLTVAFPEGPKRASALAAWSAVGAVGGAAGSLLGGLLTDLLSWRWVLLINVPVGLVVIVGSLVLIADHRTASQKLDLPGAVSITVGLSALAFGVSQTGEHGWGSGRALVPILAGVAAIGVFLALQAWVARSPLMPLGIFRSRAVSGANLIMLLLGGVTFSLWYFVSLYLQNVHRYSALEAGLSFLPHTAALVIGSRLGPRLLRRVGVRPLVVVGALVAAAGFGWQARLTADSDLVVGVLLPGALTCSGIALTFTPLAAAATSGIARGEEGLAAGILNTSRQVGGAVGLAALVTVAVARTQDFGTASAPALASGYATVFGVSAAICVAAALATFLLPGQTAPEQAATPVEKAVPAHSE
ncbi:MFS transporter [Spirillospora sp. CA-255316]